MKESLRERGLSPEETITFAKRKVLDLFEAQGLQFNAEQSTAKATEAGAALDHVAEESDRTVAERDKLQGSEAEVRELQSQLNIAHKKIDELSSELRILKRERAELHMKIATLQDSHNDTQLQQDNEILRRMVERLNEELKSTQVTNEDLKRRGISRGGIIGPTRTETSRAIAEDPDIVK